MVGITDIAPRFSSLSYSPLLFHPIHWLTPQHSIITYINHQNINLIHKRLSSNISTNKQQRKIFLSYCFNQQKDLLSNNQYNQALLFRIERYLFDK